MNFFFEPDINPNRPVHAPHWEAVKKHFDDLNEPSFAVEFFRHHEAAGWVDKYGRPIAYWPSLASGWISNSKQRAGPKNRSLKQDNSNQQKEKPQLKTAAEMYAEREAARFKRANGQQ